MEALGLGAEAVPAPSCTELLLDLGWVELQKAHVEDSAVITVKAREAFALRHGGTAAATAMLFCALPARLAELSYQLTHDLASTTLSLSSSMLQASVSADKDRE